MIPEVGPVIHEIADEIRSVSKGAVLLSEIAVSDEHLDFIHKNLSKILYGPDTDDYCIVSAYAMMEIGTRCYIGKELWPGIEEECDKSLGRKFDYSDSEHEEWFERFKKGVTLLGMEWNFGVGRIRVDNILVHTFVPDVQLGKFMKFVDGFYNNVLGGSLEGLDEYLPLVPALVLRSQSVKSSEDSNSLLPDPSLNKSTRAALSKVEIFKPLLTRILSMVHAVYSYDKLDEYDYNRYYKAFNDYLDSKTEPHARRKTAARIVCHLQLKDGELHLLLPEKICNQSDELAIYRNGKRTVTEFQPTKYSLGDTGKSYINATSVRFDKLFPGMSPFEDLQLMLGTTIWRSSPRRRFLLFDWNGRQISKPYEGEIAVYCDDDTHLEPEDCITYRQGRATFFKLGSNNVLTIGDTKMKVKTESVTETDILFDTDSDAGITDSSGSPVDLMKGDEILCEISQPSEFSYVLRINVDGQETKHIQINRDSERLGAILNYYRDRDECSFSVSPEVFGNEPHLITLGIYEQNARKIIEKRFLFVPGLEYGFDRRVYCTDSPGKFTVSVLDGPIPFTVRDEFVEWDLELPSGKIHFRHTVPSAVISLDNGRSWIYPPYPQVPLADLYYDFMLVKNGAQSDFRLSCTGITLKDEIVGKDRKYDLNETKKRISEDRHGTTFAIFCPSANRTGPVKLFTIVTKNEYKYDEKAATVTMHNVSGIRAVARYSTVGNNVLKEFQLSEGVNDVRFNAPQSVVFTICEYNELSGQYDLQRLERRQGKSNYCELNNGNVYIVNMTLGKKLPFSLKPGASRSEFEKALSCMFTFNKWLNNRTVIDELWESYESLTV